MKSNSPLKELAKVLCSNCNSAIFKNQTIMYQLLIIFSSNKLAISYENMPKSTDELIEHIKNYLHDIHLYKTQNIQYTTNYSPLHKYIYENIYNLNLNSKKYFFSSDFGLANQLKSEQLKEDYFNELQNLSSNISKSINNNTRTISHNWIMEYNNCDNNYNLIIYRIYWLLQYYFAYYLSSTKSVYFNLNKTTASNSEYISLSRSKKEYILNSLQKNCYNYSKLISLTTIDTFDLYTFSRIIFDIIATHYNHSKRVPISTAYIPKEHTTSTIPSTEIQWKEFITYVDAFGDKTLDRFNILKTFAKTNCIAANELGNLFFYGETFIYGGDNTFVLLPDYKKAIDYYKMAIQSSNPPYPVACWSLGYILNSGYCIIEKDAKENTELAKTYFKMAGKYPPAYNSLAHIELEETEELYTNYINNTCTISYKEIVQKFTSALELAGEASNMNWFYGNNIIANFILKHQHDTKLLSDIEKKIKLRIKLDVEEQLKQSCSFDNPWALNALAKYYISQGDKKKAFPYLERALSLNYNSAFYTAGMYLYEELSKKEEALKKASSLNYIYASYELAKLYFEQNNLDNSIKYLEISKKQILLSKNIDKNLLDNINVLNSKINENV